jgi:hypothetical protein
MKKRIKNLRESIAITNEIKKFRAETSDHCRIIYDRDYDQGIFKIKLTVPAQLDGKRVEADAEIEVREYSTIRAFKADLEYQFENAKQALYDKCIFSIILKNSNAYEKREQQN